MKKLFSSLLVLVFAQLGLSQNTDLGSIITPTGNIFCRVEKIAGSTLLTCQVSQSTAVIPPKPKDCNLEWDYRFLMGERSKPERACYGDVLYSPSLKRLEYGQTRKIAGFTCDLTTARLRCVNLDKHGFELSKAVQKLF
ncbi:MAG: hypothetical protein RLZZ156_310 [Deinococcota bacterium]|jgi:hypothetical protein